MRRKKIKTTQYGEGYFVHRFDFDFQFKHIQSTVARWYLYFHTKSRNFGAFWKALE
jgi:hypothetical protein